MWEAMKGAKHGNPFRGLRISTFEFSGMPVLNDGRQCRGFPRFCVIRTTDSVNPSGPIADGCPGGIARTSIDTSGAKSANGPTMVRLYFTAGIFLASMTMAARCAAQDRLPRSPGFLPFRLLPSSNSLPDAATPDPASFEPDAGQGLLDPMSVWGRLGNRSRRFWSARAEQLGRWSDQAADQWGRTRETTSSFWDRLWTGPRILLTPRNDEAIAPINPPRRAANPLLTKPRVRF
jgi:hypothetical protein